MQGATVCFAVYIEINIASSSKLYGIYIIIITLITLVIIILIVNDLFKEF
jgi:hypothetical protein